MKVQGKQYYFTLDREREKAASRADEIAAFLEVSSNTIGQAIEKFSPNKIRRTVVPALKSPTVGELISAYDQVANRVVDSTKRTCTGAIRRVASFILGLKPFQQGANKGKLNAWRARVDALPFTSITPQKLEALRGSLMKAAGTDEIQRGKAVATF